MELFKHRSDAWFWFRDHTRSQSAYNYKWWFCFKPGIGNSLLNYSRFGNSKIISEFYEGYLFPGNSDGGHKNYKNLQRSNLVFFGRLQEQRGNYYHADTGKATTWWKKIKTSEMRNEVVAMTRTLPDGSGITLSKLFQINSYTGWIIQTSIPGLCLWA